MEILYFLLDFSVNLKSFSKKKKKSMEKILSQHLLSGFQPHFSKFPISHVLLILNDLKNHRVSVITAAQGAINEKNFCWGRN